MARKAWWATVIAAIVALQFGSAMPALAASPEHYGTNSVVFEPVIRSGLPDAKGRGEIDYDGGNEPKSRWSSKFRFNGLEPNEDYVVVVRGRYGEAGTPESRAYTEICAFTATDTGTGSCFAYFRGLMRLDAVQLRLPGEGGRRIMQATRSESGAGSITTVPNRFTELEARKLTKESRSGRKAGTSK